MKQAGDAKSFLKEYESFVEAIKKLNKCGDWAISHTLKMHAVGVETYPTFSLKSYLEQDEELHPYLSAFDGIGLTINALEWIPEDKNNRGFALLGSRRLDFHHLLISNSKVILMSQEEAAHQRSSPDYYNLTFGFNDPNRKPSSEELLKIVKLKFLNGESLFNEEELKLLKQWFKIQGAQKMQELYLKHVLAGYPQKASRYQDSSLQRLFAEMY